MPFPLRAALFDLDGTLVRTFIDFPEMRRAMHALSERYGTAEVTAGEDDILEIVARMVGALGATQGARARAEAYELLEAMERAGCAHPEPVTGAPQLLRRLRDTYRIPVGIITRNSRSVALDLVAHQELAYDVLIAREDTEAFKPDPAPLRHACERLGVPTSAAAMTGDLWADIAAGRAAGTCLTIGIQWPYDPPQRFARCAPDHIVGSLAEAGALLEARLVPAASGGKRQGL